MKKNEGLIADRIGRNFYIEVVLILCVVILLGFIVYINFFYTKECKSFECFKKGMEKCERVKYTNEEPEASWGYEVKGITEGECEIRVSLLLAKQGELGIDKLTGYEMGCFYPIGEGVYPERNLEKCHGRLKEELQTIIIEKQHKYLLENLGQVDEALNRI